MDKEAVVQPDPLDDLLPWFPVASQLEKWLATPDARTYGTMDHCIKVGQLLSVARERELNVEVKSQSEQTFPQAASKHGDKRNLYHYSYAIHLPETTKGWSPPNPRLAPTISARITFEGSKAVVAIAEVYLDLYSDSPWGEICYHGLSLHTTLMSYGPEQCLSRAIAICAFDS